VVLATIFYSLRFVTSLFVASYDLQGSGGGIWPHLHMGLNSFSRAEQRRAVAYCWQPASTVTLGIELGPMAIYLLGVKTFVSSSFVVPSLIKRKGLDFFIIGVPFLYLIPPEVTLKKA
jgi:hypothetical protein